MGAVSFSDSLVSDADEVFQGEFVHKRLVFKGTVEDRPARWVLDSGALNDITIDLAYALRRGLTIERAYHRTPGFELQPAGIGGFTHVERLSAFGVDVQGRTVPVSDLFAGRPVPPDFAGLIGLGFFAKKVLALDPRRSVLGLFRPSSLPVRVREVKHQLHFLRVDDRYVPFTRDVKDALMPSPEPPVLVIDTGSYTSLLTRDYVLSRRGHLFMRLLLRAAHRFRKRIRYVFELPPDVQVGVRVQIAHSSGAYEQTVGVARVDGILGMNFLGRWISVFDLHGGVLALIRPSGG
ncbi:MAG TPA: hypothetical protein VNL18_08180 [Gemmatimonadales bacterium]|nr:hypothetical protein [Gemmatimonadales bacterium]